MSNVYTSQKDRIEGGSIGIKLYAYESWQKKETLPLQQTVSGVYKSVDTHQSIHAFKKSIYIYIKAKNDNIEMYKWIIFFFLFALQII